MKVKLVLALFALTLFGNVVMADPPPPACPTYSCGTGPGTPGSSN